MATVKTQFFKLQTKNKHMVAKGVEVEKVIKKVEDLQQEYNEMNQAHLKTHRDLKALQTDFDRLTKDFGKMEVISVKREKNLLELENTYFQ